MMSLLAIKHVSPLSTLLLTIGLSCGGFLIKQKAAESARSAAFNKLALSLGSISAGFLIYLIPDNQFVFLSLVTFLFACSAAINWPKSNNQNRSYFKSPNTNPKVVISWILLGIGIGIRVFGLFVILPQYLIVKLGALPTWYGTELSLYSSLVMLSQLPAIFKKKSFSFSSSLIALVVSCIILAFPGLFQIQLWWGCILWSFVLAIEEVFAPYIDKEASKDNALWYKEIGMGLGGGFSVFLMRSLSSPLLTGIAGVLCIVTASIILYFFHTERFKPEFKPNK